MGLIRKLFGLVFLSFMLVVVAAHAQTGETSGDNAQRGMQKEQAEVKGFRSSRFAMRESEVLKAIYKDFKISKSNLKRQKHPTEKTVSLGVTVTELLSESGETDIFQVFGYKSKKLIQVNVIWGRTITKNINPPGIVNAANSLRSYFMKKRYKTDSFVANAKLNDEQVLVFRGQDKRD